jgi:uncharacterized integral membrane protein
MTDTSPWPESPSPSPDSPSQLDPMSSEPDLADPLSDTTNTSDSAGSHDVAILSDPADTDLTGSSSSDALSDSAGPLSPAAPLAPAAQIDPASPPQATGRTRLSGLWVGVVIAAVVITLLLVFVRQNTKSVRISYFTAHGSLPLGVALLLAVIAGVLFTGLVASLRIWQLRLRLKEPRRKAARGRRVRTRNRPRHPKTA